jgi:uncharacterized protein (TIGR00369 family)
MSGPDEEAAPISEAELSALITGIPYGRFLGIDVELKGDELTLVLPFQDKLIGNAMLPALHGGAVSAFMEIAAVAQIAVVSRSRRMPKTIDIGIDYLRSGRPVATFARAHVAKLGRRIASVRVEAWQHERDEPIATLRGHFLVRD